MDFTAPPFFYFFPYIFENKISLASIFLSLQWINLFSSTDLQNPICLITSAFLWLVWALRRLPGHWTWRSLLQGPSGLALGFAIGPWRHCKYGRGRPRWATYRKVSRLHLFAPQAWKIWQMLFDFWFWIWLRCIPLKGNLNGPEV